MVQSMTGFGQSKGSFENKEIVIQLKTLNGKVTDVRFKLPSTYKEKEIELRKIVLGNCLRGKIEVNVTLNNGSGDEDYGLNTDLFAKYYTELKKLQENLSMSDKGDLMQTIIRIPNVIGVKEANLEDTEWIFLKNLFQEALSNLHEFRSQEGNSLYQDLSSCIKSIQSILKEVPIHEKDRKEAFIQKIRKNLAEFMNSEKVDKNRFEQELLFYLEKLDINEEKVRLEQHLIYFDEELNGDSPTKGKKLGFIAQEIGREINTMGAKAQFAPLQKLVVKMKEELEKIREQTLNVL